jgi:hypothetical protein
MSQNNIGKGYKNKIKITDIVELNGRIYYIPDKYVELESLSFEHCKLYKFILASVIDVNLEVGKITDISKITKTILNNYCNTAEKIFSYLITGKLNIITLSLIETSIINKIPIALIPKLNPNIVERLE